MFNIMLIAIPSFILLMVIEYFLGRAQGQKLYRLGDTLANLCQGIGNQAFSLMFKALLLGFYMLVYEHLAIFPEALQAGWVAGIACLILYDCLYYWAHRWSHEWNFLWAAHVVHHQSEEYNLSVALRQSWFHTILAFFIFLPLPLLGFDPYLFLGVNIFVTLYQFWIHTKVIKRMPGWFEYIFNTPSHHRVHHARDPKYIDKNHAAFLILWDRIFGTFKKEEEEPHYGITTPLKSHNPVWGNLHHWVEMWKLAWKAPKWRDKLKVLFARPGWRPEELGGYQTPPEVDKNAEKTYQIKVSKPMMAYAIFQFIAVIIGLVAFMNNFDRIHVYYKWIFLSLLILSTVICIAILENRKWVRYVEYVRILIIVLSLNTFYYLWFVDWLQIMLIFSIGLSLLSLAYFRWSTSIFNKYFTKDI